MSKRWGEPSGKFRSNLNVKVHRFDPMIGGKVVCFNEETFHIIVGEVVDFLPYGAEFIDRKWDDACYVVQELDTKEKSHWRPARVTPYDDAPCWLGTMPTICDVCRRKFTNNIMIDGRLRRGSWGCLCETCHKIFGCGIGKGNGQMYLLEEKSQRWFKIGG